VKKKFWMVGILLIFFGLWWLAQRGMDSGDWAIYENSRYGFSIDYPADWQMGEAPDNNDGRTFVSPDGDITCHAYGFQNALMGETGEPQTLDEFTDWLLSMDKITKMGREELVLAEQPAYELIWQEQDETIHQGTYILNSEEGRGLHCTFESDEARKSFGPRYRMMVSSFKNEVGGAVSMAECSNFLNGVIAPLTDKQDFIDTEYTEVTMTSREAWDKEKLPAKVAELEDQDYKCFPMPNEMEETKPELGINVQPAVESVLWECEKEPNRYYFLAESNIEDKAKYEAQGLNCVKQSCMTEQNLEGAVWFCSI